MNTRDLLKNKYVERGIFILSLVLVMLMFALFARQLPIEDTRLAFDWKMLWPAMRDGHIRWGAPGICNPPWSIIFVMPLGFLPLRVSWGLMMFLSLAILLASVPAGSSGWLRLLGTVLLVTSYPALRNFADANFDVLSVAGVLLVLYGYQHRQPWLLVPGVLLATIKPQTVFLLLVVLALYCLQATSARFTLTAGAAILAVVAGSMIWKGREWLGCITSLPSMGISLPPLLRDLGVPSLPIWITQLVVAGVTLGLAYAGNRDLSRVKAGMLIAASLLVSPYANGLALIAVMAIGITGLFVRKPLAGSVLFLLYNLGFLALFDWERLDRPVGYLLGAVLLITWMVLAYHTTLEKRERSFPVSSEQ